MLVLTRKELESILIDNGIEIKILEINKESVKLAITAPKEMTILRKELVDDVVQTNQEASIKVDVSEFVQFMLDRKE